MISASCGSDRRRSPDGFFSPSSPCTFQSYSSTSEIPRLRQIGDFRAGLVHLHGSDVPASTNPFISRTILNIRPKSCAEHVTWNIQ